MALQELLTQRYATKHFANKQIPQETIEAILEEMNLSPSALGLQPYQFIVIDDAETKKALAPHSFHGIDLADASHLIVIAGMQEVDDDYIRAFIERTEKLRELAPGSLADLEELTKNIVHSVSDHFAWAVQQAYVVMGVLVLSAAEKGVDMTPMEVFDREQYDRMLGLQERGLSTALVGVLGYRKEDDPDQFLKKTRKSFHDIVTWYGK